METKITKIYTFEAAHYLPNMVGQSCGHTHGHSYKVEITIAGKINADTGMVMDFAEIDRAWSGIHLIVDHAMLNKIQGLENPT